MTQVLFLNRPLFLSLFLSLQPQPCQQPRHALVGYPPEPEKSGRRFRLFAQQLHRRLELRPRLVLLSLRRVEQLSQPLPEHLRKLRRPRVIQQPHLHQVPQVYAVVVQEIGQLDPH